MSFTTILLTPHDTELTHKVLDLYRKVFEITITPMSDKNLRSILAHNLRIFASLENGNVIGAATIHILPSYENPPFEIFIWDLAVDKHFRRQGVATTLMNTIEDFARTQGASCVYVQADTETKEDHEAIQFYNTLEGYEQSSTRHFEKYLH